jgi:two-component system, NarL family, nitrate/nitrite response regulator NarL
MSSTPIRVAVVEDHRSMLWGLERLVESEAPRMRVVGSATTCAGALALAPEAHPDVILLDLDLGGENGGEIIPQLVNGGRTRVLVLTGITDPAVCEAAILRGACGLVHKGEPAETIIRAIEKVHAGELWLDRRTAGRVFVQLSSPRAVAVDPEAAKIASLTEREREIVEQLVNDPSGDSRHLAARVGIGENTLRNHLSRIYDKLGVPNRFELYLYAQRHFRRPDRAAVLNGRA